MKTLPQYDDELEHELNEMQMKIAVQMKYRNCSERDPMVTIVLLKFF